MAERQPSSYSCWEEYKEVYKPKTDFELKFVEDCWENKVSSICSTLNSSDENKKKRLANLIKWSWPVLHLAVERNHYDLAALLLSAGADPNVEDYATATAMDHVWHLWHGEEKSVDDRLKLIQLLEQFEGRSSFATSAGDYCRNKHSVVTTARP